jgi:hypothetical protein
MRRTTPLLITIITSLLALITSAQTTAPATVPNPLYDAWKNQEKKTVTFTREETISGGAPMPGRRAPTTTTISETCTQVTDAEATIAITQGDKPAEILKIPAKISPDDPGSPKLVGTEDIKIGDTTYSCKKYTYSTKNKADLGRDGQGLPGEVTVWIADNIPGGVVQRHVSLTIRVTYDVTDKIVPTD